jgi:multidrug efflux pump
MVQLPHGDRAHPRNLAGLYVHGTKGALIPLASVVDVREGIGARSLPHFDRLRSATISASLAAGAPMGRVLGDLEALARSIVPEGQGYHVTFAGQSEEFFLSGNAILFAYLLAIVIVYLVLAAQFESFLHPVTVLVAVALSFTGALVALKLTGSTLNLFSQIGLVLLVGLVTKNSILIVEFAKRRREEGASLVDAAREAAEIRFRPVVMTAFSFILGVVPLVIASGAGAAARRSLGTAVFGGMLVATLLSLVLVPALYVLVQGGAEWLGRRLRGTGAAPEGASR